MSSGYRVTVNAKMGCRGLPLKLSHVFILLTVILVSTASKFNVTESEDGFDISNGNVKVISHSRTNPWLFLGSGDTNFWSIHGNYFIKDYTQERNGLKDFSISRGDDGSQSIVMSYGNDQITVQLESNDYSMLTLTFGDMPEGYDRVWVRVTSAAEECLYGGGEQFSYFNMKGKKFPIWTREQGVGRNKSSGVTYAADAYAYAGGDYHHTYFPQPTFYSSRHFYCHVDGSNYMELDFEHTDFSEVMVLGEPSKIHFNFDDSMMGLVSKLTNYLGRQIPLPKWTSEGAVLGVQGGTDEMLKYLERAEENGVTVKALWIQDWSGKIFTSFGKRVFWNWQWNPSHYPKLDTEIKRLLKEKDVRLLAYINAHLNVEGNIHKEGEEKGYFMKNTKGETYIVDYGEYYCSTVDLTNPEAYEWYKRKIITNCIDFGFGGWMADFSEYIPVDGVFHNGMTGKMMHNLYPVLWAKINREAVEEAGKLDEIMFFMRAGGSGTQRYVSNTWAGDQNVDWSYSDGFASVIPAALSLGMSGVGVTHYDIGGFTTIVREGQQEACSMVVSLKRSEELFMRMAESAVFTSMMRTHEGNIPQVNFQVHYQAETLQTFAKFVNMFRALTKYSRSLQEEMSQTGIPTQRPLFFHYESDPLTFTIQYQYLYGADLLVAPVVEEGKTEWKLYLPKGNHNWIYLYDQTAYDGGQWATVPAPLGRPPVFYKAGSEWEADFKVVADISVGSNKKDEL